MSLTPEREAEIRAAVESYIADDDRESWQFRMAGWSGRCAKDLLAELEALRAKNKTLRDAVAAYEKAFNTYGEIIESAGWQTRGPEAWVELVLAMDKLRDAFGI